MNKQDTAYLEKLNAIGDSIKQVLDKVSNQDHPNEYLLKVQLNGSEESVDKDKIKYGFGDGDQCC